MKSPYKIVVYPARRGLLSRKQWQARVVSTANGKKLFRSSESYNNRQELIDLAKMVFPGLPVEVVGGGVR